MFQECFLLLICSKPQITGHELSPNDLSDFLSGMGIRGLIPKGLPPDVVPDTSEGGVVLEHLIDYTNVTMFTECKAKLMERDDITPSIGTGMMGIFYRPDASSTGYCRGYRAVRSPPQYRLWTSWSTYARKVTNLPHFLPPEAVANRVPIEAKTCVAGSTNCVFWAEFNDITYSCSPQHDTSKLLSNVMTPLKMIETLEETGVFYPPPSPPPPSPPAAESPPPPPPMRCMDSEIPRMPQKLIEESDGGLPDSQWMCWYAARMLTRHAHALSYAFWLSSALSGAGLGTTVSARTIGRLRPRTATRMCATTCAHGTLATPVCR